MRMNKLTLKELCEELSISTATGRNWIKLSKIEPEYVDGKPVFSSNYVAKLKKQLMTPQSSALKSRRNKKYIQGKMMYDGYISRESKNIDSVRAIVNKYEECCRDEDFASLLVYYGYKLCLDRHICPMVYTKLLGDIMDISDIEERVEGKLPWVSDYRLVYEDGEDVLGLLYISCKHMGQRKNAGAYYTPENIVKILVQQLWSEEGSISYKMPKILDPGCGTGNFLIHLPDYLALESIFGMDIDKLSVAITRLNLALKYKPISPDILYSNIKCTDYLHETTQPLFDYIIGNPPWGYSYNEQEKSRLMRMYKVAKGKSIESFDLFVEKSLSELRPGGRLAYVLPESILSVRCHRSIRSVILEQAYINRVTYLNEVFNGVQCPSIILEMEKRDADTVDIDDDRQIIIRKDQMTYKIEVADRLSKEGFYLSMTDEEYNLLSKIFNQPHATLAGNAIFAMGIVTGDNSRYLSDSPKDGWEPVLLGKDIEKYRICKPCKYMRYEPDKLQQVASEHIYRAGEKLVYRFIGDRLRFAYDNSGMLTLNSCNVVIPVIEGMDIRYILAVLNSSVADYIYRKRYKSLKVLKHHLESIPIPLANEEQQKIVIKMVTMLDSIGYISDKDNYKQYEMLCKRIDEYIASLYNLNSVEYRALTE